MIETAGTCHPWHLVDTPIPKWMMWKKRWIASHIEYWNSVVHTLNINVLLIHTTVGMWIKGRLTHIQLCAPDSGASCMWAGFLSSSWLILHNEASTGLVSQQKYHLYMSSTDFSFWDSLDMVLHHNCAGPVPMEAFSTASHSQWFFAWLKAVWQPFKI
jgi:hypothetical protein